MILMKKNVETFTEYKLEQITMGDFRTLTAILIFQIQDISNGKLNWILKTEL